MKHTTDRRRFLIGTGALLTTAALTSACGRDWVRQREVPDGASEPPIITALRYGITAPSAHNTQPWRFELLSEYEAKLFVDPQRLLPRTDPLGRQIHISHGTLLELAAIAATSFGYRAETELLPQGQMPIAQYGGVPTATIRLVPDRSSATDPLFDSIASRRSSRLAYDGTPLDAKECDEIVRQTRPGEADLAILTEKLSPLLDLVQRAMAIEVHDTGLYQETLQWFRFSANQVRERGDGLNVQTTGGDTFGARTFLTANNFQSETNQRRFLDLFAEAVRTTRGFLTLVTPSNTMADWLRAGRTYVRAQLAADSLGLRMHPVSQPLQEFEQMRSIRDELQSLYPVTEPRALQMLVRVGRSATPALSPRRALDDMLGVAATNRLSGRTASDRG